MPLILEFSQEVRDRLRQFSLQQHRPIDEASPPVHVFGGKCLACGFEVNVDYDTCADALRAVTMTHELSYVTGKRCGGQIAFVTTPLLVKEVTHV